MKIHIKDFPVYMKLGYYHSERISGQEVLVSLVVEYSDQSDSKLDDQIGSCINYESLLKAVDKCINGKEIKLLETVVCKVGENLMSEFSQIKLLELSVKKPILPFGIAKGASVSVSEAFSRGEYN